MAVDISGRWALVTGASSGIGADLARELARRGANAVLVARREERLAALADELRREHGAECEVVATDLARSGAAAHLHAELAARGRRVDILVNNAGCGAYGPFLDLPWERERAMLELDLLVLVELTKLFARDMVGRGWGRILQVASVAAFQGTPGYASYAAAKAFVLHFGEAVGRELAGTGVTCTVLSPGVTATEFLRVAGQEPSLYQRLVMMRSPRVAAIGVRALLAGRSSVVAGAANTLLAWAVRLTPRRLATALAGMLMRVGG